MNVDHVKVELQNNVLIFDQHHQKQVFRICDKSLANLNLIFRFLMKMAIPWVSHSLIIALYLIVFRDLDSVDFSIIK